MGMELVAISDGDRVRLGDRMGKVRKITTDGRAWVELDDGMVTLVFAGGLDLAPLPRCGCAQYDALFRETIHDTGCPVSMWAAMEFGVTAARAGQYGTILMTPTGARREPTPEAMRRAIIAFERTGELHASDRTPEQ